jgi:hypothetical protein
MLMIRHVDDDSSVLLLPQFESSLAPFQTWVYKSGVRPSPPQETPMQFNWLTIVCIILLIAGILFLVMRRKKS